MHKIDFLKNDNTLESIMIGLFIVAEAVNLFVTSSFTSINGFLQIYYLFCMSSIVVLFLINASNTYLKTTRFHLALFFYILCMYCITYLRYDGTSLSLLFFIVNVVFPFAIPIIMTINSKVFLQSMFVIPAISIVSIKALYSSVINNGLSMGDCYAILPQIIATISYLIFYYQYDSLKTKLLLIPFVIVNVLYALAIFVYGSRGSIISIIFCLAGLILFKEIHYGRDTKRLITISLFLVLSALVIIFFWDIVSFIATFSANRGIKIRAIDKILLLRQTSSIWNGREEITRIAISGIKERPIFGHGISTFYANTGIVYPHNVILQLAYDGGFVLLSMVVIPFVKKVIRVLKNGSIDSVPLLFTLFFASVPGALFSGDCWKNACLWLLVSMLLSNRISYRSQSQ